MVSSVHTAVMQWQYDKGSAACQLVSGHFLILQELAVAEAKNLMLPARNKHSSSSNTQQAAHDAEDGSEPADCFATCKCGSCQLCTLRSYTKHPWNINNLPQAKGSVLRFVREDVGGKPITGGCVDSCSRLRIRSSVGVLCAECR